MKIFAQLLLTAIFLAVMPPAHCAAQDESIAQLFKGFAGTCVILNLKTGAYYRFNPSRAKIRLSPCSTFKIFNSLVGLDTGVLTGKGDPMKWDGIDHGRPECNRDQTLQSAVSDSVVWYFQRVATMIGEKRMKKYIDAAHYGNEDISSGITKFWLGDTLKISADEQVAFIKALCLNELPFKRSTADTVKNLISLKTTDRGTLHGKTGSDGHDGKLTMGWFVGYVEQKDNNYVFATNITAKDHAWGMQARRITERILEQQGIL